MIFTKSATLGRYHMAGREKVLELSTLHTRTSLQAEAPEWVAAWVGTPRSTERLTDANDPRITGSAAWGERFGVVRVVVPDASHMPNLELQRATADGYHLIHDAMQRAGYPFAVRLWNFIPGIVDDADANLDRYMVFNAGRYAAYLEWFGSTDNLAPMIPTASGIGHTGHDLIIHCLCDREPGEPIENPRQVAAYRYSTKYGPLPPCFARATRIAAPDQPDQQALLIGGTSSVVGEESVHVGDVMRQTDETFENLDALVRAAGGDGLADLADVRVYHVEAEDAAALHDRVLEIAPHLAGSVEMFHVALCRRDLAVEIEGLAYVSG